MSEGEEILVWAGLIVAAILAGVLVLVQLGRFLSRAPRRGEAQRALCSHCHKVVAIHGATERCPRCGGVWPLPTQQTAEQTGPSPRAAAMKKTSNADDVTKAALVFLLVMVACIAFVGIETFGWGVFGFSCLGVTVGGLLFSIVTRVGSFWPK